MSAKGDANGIVWALNTSPASPGGPAVLNANDAVSLTSLYSSSLNLGRDNPGAAVPFSSATEVNGRVYVGTADRLSVFGLYGIGGYDLESTADRAFPFDYDGSGKPDHLALYRPGTGTIWILKNHAGNFTPVYQQGDPGSGIGGYDLKSPADRVSALDYDSSGKPDHLVLYRPGTGTIWIQKTALAGLRQSIRVRELEATTCGPQPDQAFPFDYDGSGKQDHLVLYRPGGRNDLDFEKQRWNVYARVSGRWNWRLRPSVRGRSSHTV